MKDSLKDHQLKRTDPRNFFMGQAIISDQITREGLGVVWRELEKVLQAETCGDIVEFGCYAGTTSLFIRRLLNQYQQSKVRAFHVYDSFAGLPEKSPQDNNAAGIDFEAGKLYVSKADFMHEFRVANLQLPVIHKGWFDHMTEKDVPSEIAFAFLDGDFYGSIISSLRLVWPRLVDGGVILVDDYQRETLPGVERALRDFFQGKPPVTIRAAHNIATITRNG